MYPTFAVGDRFLAEKVHQLLIKYVVYTNWEIICMNSWIKNLVILVMFGFHNGKTMEKVSAMRIEFNKNEITITKFVWTRQWKSQKEWNWKLVVFKIKLN